MSTFYKIFTAKAPVNIAVIKYWGKSNEEYKIPINDSLSGTLGIDEMCATTSLAISDSYKTDELYLNGEKLDLSLGSNAMILLDAVRNLSPLDKKILNYKVHIVSQNNFPTAAGLASSAAGYACLAYVLGHAYGITDQTELSKLARRGSGSACRSLFGGFVQWKKGLDHNSSMAEQVVDEKHWPELKVIICVVNDNNKDVSSSKGMALSVKTSHLIKYRANDIVPARIEAIKAAIKWKDFHTFASITMQDSNQFHAICLDTYPPLFYLNDTSRTIIKICTIINSHYGRNVVAYTFDAGPNACIYLLDDYVPLFIDLMKTLFPVDGGELQVKGQSYVKLDDVKLSSIINTLRQSGVKNLTNSIRYLIYTSVGSGPKMVDEHLTDKNLMP